LIQCNFATIELSFPSPKAWLHLSELLSVILWSRYIMLLKLEIDHAYYQIKRMLCLTLFMPCSAMLWLYAHAAKLFLVVFSWDFSAIAAPRYAIVHLWLGGFAFLIVQRREDHWFYFILPELSFLVQPIISPLN